VEAGTFISYAAKSICNTQYTVKLITGKTIKHRVDQKLHTFNSPY